jgi:hypothetical protein
MEILMYPSCLIPRHLSIGFKELLVPKMPSALMYAVHVIFRRFFFMISDTSAGAFHAR